MGLFRPPEERARGDRFADVLRLSGRYRTTPAGVVVTDQVAMAHSAVWACTSLYSRLISTLPFHAYRETGGISRRIATPAVLSQPNPGQRFPHWASQVVESLVLRGNAFGLVLGRNAAGRPTGVQVLHPDLVQARYDYRSDEISYRIGGVEVPADAVWRCAINVGPGSPFGKSVLEYAAQSVGLGVAAQRYGSEFFGSGGHPTGVLETEQELTGDQAEAIRQRWAAAMQDQRGVAVLGLGFGYRPVQITPTDTEFLNAYKLSVQDVCRFFSIPPEMVGSESGASMTYSNVESRALDLLRYAIDPVLVELEAGLTELLPVPQYVQANRDALLRMTTRDRYEAHASALSAGWMSVDEVRELEDLPPLEEPDPVLAEIPAPMFDQGDV